VPAVRPIHVALVILGVVAERGDRASGAAGR
jgi:hypothetical protein